MCVAHPQTQWIGQSCYFAAVVYERVWPGTVILMHWIRTKRDSKKKCPSASTSSHESQCFPTFYSLRSTFTDKFLWGALWDIAVKQYRKNWNTRNKQHVCNTYNLLLMLNLRLVIRHDKIKSRLDGRQVHTQRCIQDTKYWKILTFWNASRPNSWEAVHYPTECQRNQHKIMRDVLRRTTSFLS